MRIVVIGAGVVAAGHDVSILVRGSRKTTLERDGVRLQPDSTPMSSRPHIVTADQLGTAVDLTIVAVRATQIPAAFDLLDTFESLAVAFLQHLGVHADQVRSRVGVERTVLAFPGIGGRIGTDGSIEYVEIASQPTTIDKMAAQAEVFRTVVASTGMRTALEIRARYSAELATLNVATRAEGLGAGEIMEILQPRRNCGRLQGAD